MPRAPTCQAGRRGEPREAAGAGPALRGRDLGAGTERRGGSTSVRRPLHLARSWTAGCGFRWDAESAGAPERSRGALGARPKGRLHAHRLPSSSSAPAPRTTACQPRPPRGAKPGPGLSTKRRCAIGSLSNSQMPVLEPRAHSPRCAHSYISQGPIRSPEIPHLGLLASLDKFPSSATVLGWPLCAGRRANIKGFRFLCHPGLVLRTLCDFKIKGKRLWGEIGSSCLAHRSRMISPCRSFLPGLGGGEQWPPVCLLPQTRTGKDLRCPSLGPRRDLYLLGAKGILA